MSSIRRRPAHPGVAPAFTTPIQPQSGDFVFGVFADVVEMMRPRPEPSSGPGRNHLRPAG